jgi:uncharacterized integral membrane protein
MTLLRKILTAIVVVPLLVVIVGFAVANRQSVTISFDPFDQAHPAYAVSLPLFIIIFILIILGVVVGGIASWLRQGHHRRASRRLDAEVRGLHNEMHAMRSKSAEPTHEPARPPPPDVPLILPPTP